MILPPKLHHLYHILLLASLTHATQPPNIHQLAKAITQNSDCTPSQYRPIFCPINNLISLPADEACDMLPVTPKLYACIGLYCLDIAVDSASPTHHGTPSQHYPSQTAQCGSIEQWTTKDDPCVQCICQHFTQAYGDPNGNGRAELEIVRDRQQNGSEALIPGGKMVEWVLLDYRGLLGLQEDDGSRGQDMVNGGPGWGSFLWSLVLGLAKWCFALTWKVAILVLLPLLAWMVPIVWQCALPIFIRMIRHLWEGSLWLFDWIIRHTWEGANNDNNDNDNNPNNNPDGNNGGAPNQPGGQGGLQTAPPAQQQNAVAQQGGPNPTPARATAQNAPPAQQVAQANVVAAQGGQNLTPRWRRGKNLRSLE